ncbi:bifunctional metallophosphatase/5'-nucleotidase [Corynebacterium cystitidis]|uniref:bifunctional metallophosphatase/5'-nucleotidase n=1 Tax=Corynebacterium cystitidis TaxID=35757 RepID=UPI00211E8BDA|nr:bifunctional UDP-sugar hydrolase/5'-nucleotidase [Corynebacterium cystitidis]
MSKFRRAGRLIAATTTSVLVLSFVVVANAQDNTVTISIANVTDFHRHLEDGIPGTTEAIKKWVNDPKLQAEKPRPTYIGTEMGAANIAGLLEYVNQDADYSLKTTSGDNVGGTAFVSSIANDEPTIDTLNAMGIDVNAAGNHEFDQGQDDLMNRLVPRHDSKILAANVYKSDGTRLLAPSEVYDFGGVKLGVVGTTSNLTPRKVSPGGIIGLDFRDASAEANAEAKRLKESGDADIVIVLQHDPAEVDYKKFDAEYVDFLFGGDTHLQQLDTEADVPYAQSWEYGKLVSDLDITYDRTTGEIVELTVEQYDAEDFVNLAAEGLVAPDAEVAKIVEAAVAEANVRGKEVIANVDQSFYRGSNPDASPGSNRGVESTANNLLAESNRQALDAFLGGGVIDFGVMNAGGVRDDLPAGDVTVEQAHTIQPFGNELSYATLSGQAILDAMERQWQDYIVDAMPGGRPRLSMGVSDNVDYIYDPNKPFGERISYVTIDGKPLDPAADYKVATATFLFEGGDGFINPDDVRDQVNVGYMDVTAFIDYLKSGNATVRNGQGEVGVILPTEGLKAGQTNTVELTSLNYSTDGEPLANTVTLRIGETEVTTNIDNSTTDDDKGFGEFGRATVDISLPGELSGEQTLTVITDAGTDISMPVQVAEAAAVAPDPVHSAPALSASPVVGAMLSLAAILGLGGLIAVLFPNQIDAALTNLI